MQMKKEILVTGGSGYKGTVLIKKLVDQNYRVINIDNNLFGKNNLKHKNVKNYNLDISEIKKINLKNVYACIHLASIANDPMVDLDQSLSWETSALGTKILVDYLIEKKVKKIIYASSGSVYGIKKEKKVKEHLSLEPISTYNKVKMVTERLLISYKEKINVVIVRPATVCGISKRMRLDVSVNALTFQALKNKTINVFGGSQKRPNIHIDDITDLYIFFIKKKIKFGIFNAGFENLSILNIAKKIQNIIPSKILIKNKNFDPRSYNLDSSKLLKLGFKPKKKIEDAINEIKDHYQSGKLKEKPNFYSVQWLKKKLKKL
jgi:nucleoside-diphosphate-sugar epimerase